MHLQNLHIVNFKNYEDSEIELSGLLTKKILLKSANDYSLHHIDLDEVRQGIHHLAIKSKGGIIDFDGLIIANMNDAEAIDISTPILSKVPEITKGPIQNSIILKYPNIDKYYGLYNISFIVGQDIRKLQ